MRDQVVNECRVYPEAAATSVQSSNQMFTDRERERERERDEVEIEDEDREEGLEAVTLSAHNNQSVPPRGDDPKYKAILYLLRMPLSIYLYTILRTATSNSMSTMADYHHTPYGPALVPFCF